MSQGSFAEVQPSTEGAIEHGKPGTSPFHPNPIRFRHARQPFHQRGLFSVDLVPASPLFRFLTGRIFGQAFQEPARHAC